MKRSPRAGTFSNVGTAGDLKIAHYLLAVEGLAMVRGFLTDPGGLDPRAEEVTMIVEGIGTPPLSTLIPVDRYDVDAGYSLWAPRYDGPNPAIEAEEPVFRQIISELVPASALDAACGTGRHAEILLALGWDVTGVDATEAMLERARVKNPRGTFRPGRLEALPMETGSVDLVVCGLALTHVANLAPVFAEFGRVLRPGGRVVTTDMHPMMTATGGMAAFPIEDTRPDVAAGEPMSIHFVPNLVHNVADYVAAIIGAGLELTGCHEPLVDEVVAQRFPSFAAFPDATRQAFVGLPYLLIWEATKRSGSGRSEAGS
jgi:SAM-dependent methyltransferase